MSGVSVDEHVAGRGAQHALPPGELDVPTTLNALSGAFTARWVEPFYLEDPARLAPAQAEAWCAAARACDDTVLDALLAETDWRPRVVGAWLVALRGGTAFEERLGRLLLRSEVCFAGRAYAVVLASLATPHAADWLERYLRHYLTLPALDYDQAEAMAALRHLDAPRAAALGPAWDAFVAGRKSDPLPRCEPHVLAQLEALARLRQRAAEPAPSPAPAPAPAPAPVPAPPFVADRRSRSLAARLQRWLEKFGRALRGR